jgi:hypothetical protein
MFSTAGKTDKKKVSRGQGKRLDTRCWIFEKTGIAS